MGFNLFKNQKSKGLLYNHLLLSIETLYPVQYFLQSQVNKD